MKKNLLLRCACVLAVLSAFAMPMSAGSSGRKSSTHKESSKKESKKKEKTSRDSKSNKDSSSAAKKSTNEQETVDTSIWDLSVLDTARDVDYMEEIEKDVVLEMNMARSNPRKYAELYIEPRIKEFNGKTYGGMLLTFEGADVVRECVKFMSSQKSLPSLLPSKGLTRAAKDLSDTQSRTNQTGHTAPDGSDPFQRMKRYGSYSGTAGENVSYGSKSAREIVVSLLIDDGVTSRGHRKNILSKGYTVTGIGFAGTHKAYGCECVLDFADGYKEKE